MKKQTRGLIILFFLLFFWGNTCPLFANSKIYDYEVTVFDEAAFPMVAVNVFTDDMAKVSDFTNNDGKVVLSDLDENDIVNFTFLGYESLRLHFWEIKNMGGIIRMKPEPIIVGPEIVVIGRVDTPPEDMSYNTQSVDKKDIALTNPQTAADALAQHGGVFVQKSQMGGGSPNIRGFEANRVLLVVDGVRMNNAIYRNGHLQNAITVDNSVMERIEVIFGPGSLLYGSDALGGVVHFRTRDPKLHFGKAESYKMDGNVFTRYSTANQEGTFHADINYGSEKWGSLTSFSYTSFGDLVAGKNHTDGYEEFGLRQFFIRRKDGVDQKFINVAGGTGDGSNDNFNLQVGTGYSQWDMMQKIRFQPGKRVYFIGNFQFSSSTDVPRYDALAETKSIDPEDLKWAEWHYGPQKRLLASLKTRILSPSKIFDKATIIASFQNLNEDRFKRKFRKSHAEFSLEDVYVYSLTADFDKALDKDDAFNFAYGVDANYNEVNSTGGRIDADRTEVLYDRLSRYPGNGSDMTTLGAYTNLRWKNQDSTLNIEASLRYSYASLNAKFPASDSLNIEWPDFYIDGIGTNNHRPTYGLGINYQSKNQWQVRVLGASAFRSPNIDDFAKIREKGGKVTTPNPELKPEYSWTGEMTLAKTFGNFNQRNGAAFKISATGFYTYLKDAILRRAYPIFPGGPTEIDGLETQANINAENATVYGVSGNILFKIGENWKLRSGANYTKGRQSFRKIDKDSQIEIDTMVALSHIPPFYGQTSLSFENERLTLSAVARYNGKKNLSEYAVNDIIVSSDGEVEIDLEGTPDNIDLSYSRIVTNDDGNLVRVYDGTLAWSTYNFYSSFRFGKDLKYTLDFAVENILDLHYRPFASGVSAAGRNFILALRAKL